MGKSKLNAQSVERNPSKRRGKEIEQQHSEQEDELEREIEQMIDEGLRDTSGSEDEVPTQRVAKTKEKVKRAAPVKQRNRSANPTKPQLLNHLKNGVTWAPTRFPSASFLKKTGLYDGVFQLLEHMGMEALIKMEAQPLYEEASCHFLSSLEVIYHRGQHEENGRGTIQFKVKGKQYRLTFREIAEIMGFIDARYDYLPTGYGVQDNVWHLITGNCAHNPQKNKNSTIRNPIIRYVHRILGNTIFARRESGNVLDDELILIGMGLQHLVGKDEIYHDEEDIFEDFGTVGYFVKRLNYYRGWAWTTTDKTPQLNIGGLITPLLKAAGVPLDDDPKGPQGPVYMDGIYMKKNKFISGMFENRYVYSFHVDNHGAELLLPNTSLCRINTTASLAFHVPQEIQLGPHGPLDPVHTKQAKSVRKSAASSSTTAFPIHTAASSGSQAAPDVVEEEAPDLDDPSRYYFQPHTGALPRGALRDAHEYIGKLEGWNRLQDKSYNKLKAKYKALKKTVKKMGDFLVKAGIGGCTAEDFTVEGTSAPLPRRKSYHGKEAASNDEEDEEATASD